MERIQDDANGQEFGFEISTEPGIEDESFVPAYECPGIYKLSADKDEAIKTSDSGQGPSNFRNRNGNQFQQNRPNFRNQPFRRKFQRYHLDIEQKYGQLRPGAISNRLRQALGLRRDELPAHIYQMRNLGYPPGWLEEAKIVHSGLSVFDSKGNIVKEKDEDEDGELIDYEQRSKYDINKLVEYPGFNVLPNSRYVDEWEEHGSVPMLERHSLEHMVSILMPNAAKAYKRRKMSNQLHTATKIESEITVEDMETEETPATTLLPEDNCKFIPPLPDVDDKPPPPPPSPPEEGEAPKSPLPESTSANEDTQPAQVNEETSQPAQVNEETSQPAIVEEVSNISNVESDSLSLSELEDRKKELMSQLHESNSSNSIKESSTGSTPTVERIKTSARNTPSPSQAGKMVSVDLGTPVLKSFSPFSKLPSSEAFSKNICDVINFENLPDSTGVYERMVGVLSKVRQAVKRIQQED